jgi:hypothetical protein
MFSTQRANGTAKPRRFVPRGHNHGGWPVRGEMNTFPRRRTYAVGALDTCLASMARLSDDHENPFLLPSLGSTISTKNTSAYFFSFVMISPPRLYN